MFRLKSSRVEPNWFILQRDVSLEEVVLDIEVFNEIQAFTFLKPAWLIDCFALAEPAAGNFFWPPISQAGHGQNEALQYLSVPHNAFRNDSILTVRAWVVLTSYTFPQWWRTSFRLHPKFGWNVVYICISIHTQVRRLCCKSSDIFTQMQSSLLHSSKAAPPILPSACLITEQALQQVDQ